VHIVKIVELLVELEVPFPLRRTVDEPRPARNANTKTTPRSTATVSFLMPQRVASRGVKFY
jgi:hypothetical protein